MLKRLKSVSMMLFLMGASTGAASVSYTHLDVYKRQNSISAKEAYENGVRANFEYLGLSQYVNQYRCV